MPHASSLKSVRNDVLHTERTLKDCLQALTAQAANSHARAHTHTYQHTQLQGSTQAHAALMDGPATATTRRTDPVKPRPSDAADPHTHSLNNQSSYQQRSNCCTTSLDASAKPSHTAAASRSTCSRPHWAAAQQKGAGGQRAGGTSEQLSGWSGC